MRCKRRNNIPECSQTVFFAVVTKVLFIGSKAIGLRSLEIIHRLSPESISGVMTLDDSNDDRSVLGQFEMFCEENELNLSIVNTRYEADQAVRNVDPDICLVVGWYWLIKQEILAVASMGFLGIHHSLLPKYRGSSPLVWSIINGDNQVGTTLFSFTEDMDDGPIWAQAEVDVEEIDDIATLLKKLDHEVGVILENKWLGILDGSSSSRLPDLSQSTFCDRRHPKHGQIDWSNSAKEVFNFIRAQTTPYPGAFSGFDGEKILIWSSRMLEETEDLPAGMIYASESQLVVMCGNGTQLEILEWGRSVSERRDGSDFEAAVGEVFVEFLENEA